MKAGFYGYRADIIGLLWLALALFFSLALGSYDPMDPSFNSLSTLQEVRNRCGYLGSFLSDLLYQFFGLGAWIFVLAGLKKSLEAFQRQIKEGGKIKALSVMALCLFVCSSLLELHQAERSFFQGHIHAGGILGRMVIQSSQPYLHFAGHLLLFWSLALVLFVLITKSSVSGFFVKSVFLLKSQARTFLTVGGKKGGELFVKTKGFCLSALSSSGLFLIKKIGFKIKQKDPASSGIPGAPDKKNFFFYQCV